MSDDVTDVTAPDVEIEDDASCTVSLILEAEYTLETREEGGILSAPEVEVLPEIKPDTVVTNRYLAFQRKKRSLRTRSHSLRYYYQVF